MHGSWLKTYLAENDTDLVEKIRRGQVLARHHMIARGWRLAATIADRYAEQGIDRELLISEGMRQFFFCLEKFDANQASNFSRYAAWWMKYGMAQLVNRRMACCYN